MFRIIKQLLLVPVFVALVALGFLLTNQTNHAYAFKTDGVCFWDNQGKIKCKYETWIGGAVNGVRTTLDKLTPSPSEIPIIGSAVKFDPTTWDEQLLGAVKGGCLASDCDDYFYHPKLSEEAGYPIFGGGQGNHPEYLHFVSQNPVIAYTSNSPGKLDPKKLGNADDPNWMPIAKIDNANKFGDKDMCGIMKPAGGCKIDGGDGMPGGTYSGPPLDTASFKKTIESIQSLNAFKKACEKEAPLGFITCPIFNAINSAISSLIGGQGVSGQRDGLLISFLEFSPLNAQDSTQNNILPQIVSSIVSIANLFYVVIFLILIFSSTLPFGLDNYTIKKTFPKFIAAVIMTQFSYLICGVIIDFFNLLGNIVPNLIFALPLGLDFEAQGISGLSVGLQTVFASGPLAVSLVFGFFLLLILMFVALIAIIVAFVYMVLRYLILFILVLLAPLAFASWVLPGTDRFFKAWWKNFIRLNAMFPMITGLIAVSIMLSQVLLATDETNAALKLVALFIPIVALFAIPKTLKWTSDGMNALAGKMLGGTASKMPGGGNALGGKAAKQAANKAYDYGKKETVSFGKRRAAEMGIGTEAWRRRQQTKDIEEYKGKAKERISNLDRNGLRDSSVVSMGKAANNPKSTKALGEARAHLDQLVQSGDAVGIANALTSFRDAARSSGLFKGDEEIADYWNNNIVTGSNYSGVKTMSPNLVPADPTALNHTNMTSDIKTKELKIASSGGDYSGTGSSKIAELDKDVLSSHAESGASAADLHFDQKAAEEALTSDTVKWGNPKAKAAFQDIVDRAYNSGQWTRPAGGPGPGPTGGPTTAPTTGPTTGPGPGPTGGPTTAPPTGPTGGPPSTPPGVDTDNPLDPGNI